MLLGLNSVNPHHFFLVNTHVINNLRITFINDRLSICILNTVVGFLRSTYSTIIVYEIIYSNNLSFFTILYPHTGVMSKLYSK